MPVLHNQKSPICFSLSTPALISEAFLCFAAWASAQMKNVIRGKETKVVAYITHAKQLIAQLQYFGPLFRMAKCPYKLTFQMLQQISSTQKPKSNTHTHTHLQRAVAEVPTPPSTQLHGYITSANWFEAAVQAKPILYFFP